MLIREAKFSDYSNIILLINRNGLKHCSEDEWKNLWIKNPVFLKYKTSLGWVAEIKSNIIGYFGTFPMQYHFKNKSYIAAASHTLVVDEGYRGITMKLAMNFFNQKNVDLFLMTTVGHPAANKLFRIYKAKEMPDNNYQRSLFLILKFENIIEFIEGYSPFLKKIPSKILLQVGKVFLNRRINYWRKKSYKNVRMIDAFDDRFNILWEKYLNQHSEILCFNRSQQSLTWHYGHLIKNKGWVVVHESDGIMDGYIICIEKKNNGLTKMVAVDLVVVAEFSETIYEALLLRSANEASNRGYDIFELVGFNKEIKRHFYNLKPFTRRFSLCPYLYKTDHENLKIPLSKEEHWNPSMIDGDASI